MHCGVGFYIRSLVRDLGIGKNWTLSFSVLQKLFYVLFVVRKGKSLLSLQMIRFVA